MSGNIKPEWLDKKIDLQSCREVKELLRGLSLNTVCEEAKCPNIGECFSCGVVTIMILGRICTRGCKFCGVSKSKPLPIDKEEPMRVGKALERLKLRYVVITSPTRDDLPDGGLGQFTATVNIVKKISSHPRVEILVPDFSGNVHLWKGLVLCGADVISHNIETVPSLYKKIRSGADYQRSLDLLHFVKINSPAQITKSGLMLGLGESPNEVFSVLKDLRAVGCDILTVGQYLPPSKAHYPVKEYVDLKVYKDIERFAKSLGFSQVKCAPYVRSSFLAEYP